MLPKTLDGGLPRIRLQIAVLAARILLKEPRMWILLSARTIRVFVTFSMVNFIRPPLPAMRPIARDRWSPFSGFTVEEKIVLVLEKKCFLVKQKRTILNFKGL